VIFTSLAPLATAPGQILRAESLATPFGPATDLSLAFGLGEGALAVTGGEAKVGGGVLRLSRLQAPLAGAGPVRGELEVAGVQLHDLVESSPFGDRVELDARVSGGLPFESREGRLRIHNGRLRAIQPGRLSIQRSALSTVAASGATATPAAPASASAPSSDTFTDFAYQAMENLAFSTLEAQVDSHPDGRLGVLLHVIGKHDPPQHQEIRLSLGDLIQRRFLGRKLPLPSGTGVNLTLDTTLNLDDLLADYAAFRRLRGSAQVQP